MGYDSHTDRLGRTAGKPTCNNPWNYQQPLPNANMGRFRGHKPTRAAAFVNVCCKLYSAVGIAEVKIKPVGQPEYRKWWGLLPHRRAWAVKQYYIYNWNILWYDNWKRMV